MPKISIIVPYHDSPQTAFFLCRLLATLNEQTYKNYEIVLMKEGRMGKTYNACMKKATGDILKFMGMDDYFLDKDSLQKIVDAFKDESVYWLATGCYHDQGVGPSHYHAPSWNDKLYQGYNTVGGFATINIRNKDIPEIDESLDWTVDVDWYWRIYQKHGIPFYIPEAVVVIGVGPHQTTEKITQEQKDSEWEITTNKYA